MASNLHRVKKSQESEMSRNIFPKKFSDWLLDYSQFLSIPFESVFCSFLINVSSISSESCIKITKAYKEYLSLYLVLVGHPGSNKSSSIRLSKRSMELVERFFLMDEKSVFKTEEEIIFKDYQSAINNSILLFLLLKFIQILITLF